MILPRRLRRGTVVIVLLCAAVVLPSVAKADAASALDKASAETLFEDAMRLIADKRYAEACPKLEESQRLDPAIGTQYRLAECYEAVGRTASAWANYLEVVDTAKNGGQADRERLARERARGVEAKLWRLTIVVSTPDLPGLEVRRGGVVLGRALWGTAVPLDPASYEVTASAPGKVAWSGTATAPDAGTSSTLSVPELQDAPPVPTPGPSIPPIAAQAQAPRTPGVLPPPVAEASRTRIGVVGATSLIVAGAGVLGLGVGAGFGIDAIVKKNDAASSGCTGNQCTVGAGSTRDEARSAANLATAFFTVGGVLAAGGLGLWLFGPRTRESGPVASIAPGGVVVSGRW